MEHVFLVVFDLDGVIVNTSSFHYRAWKRLLAEEWGVEHTQEVDDMTKGIGRYECLRLITQQYGLSVPETSFRALADRKNSYYVQLLHTELGPENILPGIPETFSLLRQAHIPTALASSSFNAPYVVQKLGLHFDYHVDPGSIAHGKPAPDIYLNAVNHFGYEPQHCIGIEDAVSGVASVKQAGLYCIGVGDAALLKDCDSLAASTAQLPGILKKLIGTAS